MARTAPATIPILLVTWTALVVAPSGVGGAAAQGLLDQLREEVRTAEVKQESDNDEPAYCNHCGSCDCDCPCEEPFQEAVGTLLLIGVASPFWLPPRLFADDYRRPGYFPRHPYRGEVPGYMMIDPWLPAEPFPWSLRARAEYLDDFDQISQIGGHLLLETTSRWGLEGQVDYRRERWGLDLHDSLWTGDLNVVFRFAQSEHVQMRTGVGANWLADSSDTDFGFNFTYGGDWFPRRPWIISAELDVGRLGHATLFHVRSTAGVQFHGVEVFTGYDYYRLGDAHIDGLLGGLRLWY